MELAGPPPIDLSARPLAALARRPTDLLIKKKEYHGF